MKNKKTITKWTIIKLLFPLIELGMIALGMVSILIIAMFLNQFYYSDLILIVATFLIFGGSISGIFKLYIASRAVIRLNRQERECGFNFNDEMEKYNITTGSYRTDKWFIDIRNSIHYLHSVVILRKDFIHKVSKIKEKDGAGFYNRSWAITVTTIDGKKQRIYMAQRNRHENNRKDVILDFEKWFNQKGHIKTTTKRIKKDLKN